MATAKDAKVMMETSQTTFDYTAATDSGDHTVFTVSGKTIFSNRSGYTLNVRPDGVVTGRNMLSTHADNDKVTIAAFTCYLAGVLTTVTATTGTITRPSSDVLIIPPGRSTGSARGMRHRSAQRKTPTSSLRTRSATPSIPVTLTRLCMSPALRPT